MYTDYDYTEKYRDDYDPEPIFTFDREVGLWYKDNSLYDDEEVKIRREERLRKALLAKEQELAENLVLMYPDYEAVLGDIYNTIVDRLEMMDMDELESVDEYGGGLTLDAWRMYNGDDAEETAHNIADVAASYAA